MGWSVSAADNMTDAITLLGQQTQVKRALLDYLPSVFINQAGSLAAVAVVATPIQKLCDT